MPLSLRMILPMLLVAFIGLGSAALIAIGSLVQYDRTRDLIVAIDAVHEATDQINESVFAARDRVMRVVDMATLFDIDAEWDILAQELAAMDGAIGRLAAMQLGPATQERSSDLRATMSGFSADLATVFGRSAGDVPTRDRIAAQVAAIADGSWRLGEMASGDMTAQAAAARVEFERLVLWRLGLAIAAMLAVIAFALLTFRKTAGAVRAVADRLALAAGHVAGPGAAPSRQDEVRRLQSAAHVYERRAVMLTEFQDQIGRAVASGLQGDFTGRLPENGDPDLARVATQMNQLFGGVSAAVSDVSAMMTRIAQGDLAARIDGRHSGVFATLARDANTTAERLSQIVSGIETATGAINHGMDRITDGAQTLADRTQHNAGAVDMLSRAMAEMSTSARQAAQDAGDARAVSSATVARAELGDSVSRETIEAINQIEEITSKINEITGMVDDIAFQTSILAINASIEAARAGEAGKGFGIVAQEVRSLAQRSSDAARDIADLVSRSVDQVSIGSRKVHATRDVLGAIKADIERLDLSVTGIAESSRNQANRIVDVGRTISTLDDDMRKNTALAAESAAAASSATDAASRLDAALTIFRPPAARHAA